MSADARQDPLPISVVAHHAFCPRRAWLEVHGERTDTGQMAHGTADHTAVDDPASSRDRRQRAVDVASAKLSIVGRCDTVEWSEDGEATVIEHKANPVRRSSRVTEPQRIQLALQALCLAEQGHDVAEGAVWFSTTRRRVRVELDDDLLDRARKEIELARKVIESDKPPDPLEDDPRCRRCSHVDVCLPDEHRRRYPSRRIGVADPTGRVLHLATPGSRASLRRGRIEIDARGQPTTTIPYGHVVALVVHGNAEISSALVRQSLADGRPIVWCSWSGRVDGWTVPAQGPNGEARGRQHRLGDLVKLRVARAIVAAKLRNQAALLRRHALPARRKLRDLAREAPGASSQRELFGIEGRGAALYFKDLSRALAPEWATIERRTSRPARDPVNAALNLAYGLLLGDVIRAITACGLDPAGGVFHTAKRNKPALALDLMEELRAPMADSAVIWAVNNGELRAEHFTQQTGSVRMKQAGRKALIAAYERRATTEFRHPQFGYRISWRRAMEVQARMFLALLFGDVDRYVPIEIR